MTKVNIEIIVEAKEVFKRLAHSHNMHVRHYHCDNGLFDTKAFKTSIKQAQQTVSVCGVNAHYQNDKAERCMCDVTT